MTFTRYPSLKEAAVYITGGASGIGAALVEAFAAQGARVAFADIDAGTGKALAGRIGDAGGHAPVFHALDVTDTDALQQAIRDTAAQFGTLSILINNVANDTRHAALDVTPESWRQSMAINLDAAYFASQAAIPMMQQQGGGSIVIFSSINALLGPDNMPAYVTAKAGLIGMAKALAAEFGKDKIRVNTILPGWVATDRQLALWLTPEEEAEWAKQTALPGRIDPMDVAKLALFLAADDSAKITGQAFTIDAGRT